MECLFIGGCADGRRINVNINRDYFNVPNGNYGDYHSYRLMKYYASKSTFYICIWSNYSDAEAFQALLNGYRL